MIYSPRSCTAIARCHPGLVLLSQSAPSPLLLRCCSSLTLVRHPLAETTIDYDRAILYTALPILTVRTFLRRKKRRRETLRPARDSRHPNWRNGQGGKPKTTRGQLQAVNRRAATPRRDDP